MASFFVRQAPNTITCCNLISGCIATKFALAGQYKLALTFIIAGAVFDFFDGFTARLLKVSSAIGKELDSLADCTTFGFAPAAMIFAMMEDMPACQQGTTEWLPYAAFIVAAFSAVRLAKFNLDTRQATSFIGLPTPANALFWSALIISVGETLTTADFGLYATLALIVISSWALVSEVPMFALKFKTFAFAENKLRFGFIASSIAILAIFKTFGIVLVIVWYVILSALTQHKKR